MARIKKITVHSEDTTRRTIETDKGTFEVERIHSGLSRISHDGCFVGNYYNPLTYIQNA